MATATRDAVVTHLYDTYGEASNVVSDLVAAGIPSTHISVVGSDGQIGANAHATDEASGTATGAGIGTAIGAGAGLLAGIGMIAIPGIGPVVAAGWLAATAAGAAAGMAAGGLIGALTDMGVSEDHAHVYAEGVRRGGTLVSVRTSGVSPALVEEIMERHNPADPDVRGDEYRKTGWNRFEERIDPNRPDISPR